MHSVYLIQQSRLPYLKRTKFRTNTTAFFGYVKTCSFVTTSEYVSEWMPAHNVFGDNLKAVYNKKESTDLML